MGIRSILGLGKGSKDDKEKSENPEDIKAALEAIKADLEAVTAEEKRAAKAKAKADPNSKVKSKPEQSKKKKINLMPETKPKIKIPERKKKTVARSAPSEPTSATTYGETVRDRINRVKSGHMTDEEKAAFLNSALTRTPPGSNGPPIRQEIPAANGSSRGASSSSASPFPKDALWNTLSNGKSSSSSSSSSSGNAGRYGNTNLTGDSDSAKREYLDMVTNPDRFKSYAAMGGYRSKTPQASNSSSKGDVVENLNMLDTPSADDNEADLASRLESAAILKEKQDAEAKARKEEEERTLEAKLQEEQRRRSEEMRRVEEERLAAKRAEEEAKVKAEQDAKDAEAKRIADMQAAQDSYWAKKLEEENARRDRSMAPQDKISLGEKMRSDAEARLAKAAMEASRKAEVERMREEERKREDPHESEILKEVSLPFLHYVPS